MAWRWIASVSLSVPSMSNSKASSRANAKRPAGKRKVSKPISSGIDRRSHGLAAQARRVEGRADGGAEARRDQAVIGRIERQLLAEGLEDELAALKHPARVG